jgi:hypothetical protein
VAMPMTSAESFRVKSKVGGQVTVSTVIFFLPNLSRCWSEAMYGMTNVDVVLGRNHEVEPTSIGGASKRSNRSVDSRHIHEGYIQESQHHHVRLRQAECTRTCPVRSKFYLQQY